MIVDAPSRGGHRFRRVAVERVVGPQGASEEASTADNHFTAVEQVDARLRRTPSADRERQVEIGVVELVVAGDDNDLHAIEGLAGPALFGDPVDGKAHRIMDVAREHDDVGFAPHASRRPPGGLLQMEVG